MVAIIVGSTVLADLLQSFEMKRHVVEAEDLRPGRYGRDAARAGSTRAAGAGCFLHGDLFLRLHEAAVGGRFELRGAGDGRERCAGDACSRGWCSAKTSRRCAGPARSGGLRSGAAGNVSGSISPSSSLPARLRCINFWPSSPRCATAANRRPPTPGNPPPVSILKPVYGKDAGFYEAIRTHASQQYPEFEILFGIRRADDPARLEVERLMREFPALPIRLVLCTTSAPNLKGRIADRSCARSAPPDSDRQRQRHQRAARITSAM